MTRARILSLAVALACLAAGAQAAPRCVNTAGKAPCFKTIQAAVDAAGPRDVITIGPGTYYENVIVPAGKDGLTIGGASALSVTLDPDLPNAGLGFNIASASVKIQRLTIRNGAIGVVVTGNDATIQGTRIVAPRGLGVGIAILNGATDAQILANELRGVGNIGVLLQGANTGAIVKGNTFVGMPTAISATGTSDLQILSNRIQVAQSGIMVTADTPTINGNLFEAVEEAITVTGQAPIVQANRHTAGTHLAQVTCTGCSGGTVSRNLGTGVSQGIAVAAGDTGMDVENNRMVDGSNPFFLTGTGIHAAFNTVSGGTSVCFLVEANDATLERNTATRCGGAGYYVKGSGNVLSANAASDSGPFGFEVLGANNTLTNNKASFGDGQGFGIVGPAATGTTVTGNVSLRNRIDFCNNSGNAPAVPVPDNLFDPDFQSTTCDITFVGP